MSPPGFNHLIKLVTVVDDSFPVLRFLFCLGEGDALLDSWTNGRFVEVSCMVIHLFSSSGAYLTAGTRFSGQYFDSCAGTSSKADRVKRNGTSDPLNTDRY
jgi:hypothetical protein